jgi:hypothetical protein
MRTAFPGYCRIHNPCQNGKIVLIFSKAEWCRTRKRLELVARSDLENLTISVAKQKFLRSEPLLPTFFMGPGQ